MRRLFLSAPLAGLAMLWCTSAALAGGWAVTTLDALPQQMQAGQTNRIGFMMRQHGVQPITFGTIAEGGPGHYVAEVTFPHDGEWVWYVDQAPFQPQTLGAITIGAPGP